MTFTVDKTNEPKNSICSVLNMKCDTHLCSCSLTLINEISSISCACMYLISTSHFCDWMRHPERDASRGSVFGKPVFCVCHAKLLQCFTFSDLDSEMLRKVADGSAPLRAEHVGGSGYFLFRCVWSPNYPNIAQNRAASIVCTLHRRVLKMGLHTCVSHLLIAFLLQTQYPVCGSSSGSISL